jgi:hypothetical protein
VRTRQGELAEAMPRIRAEIARAENVILESNSVLRFLQPDLFATVLDPQIADFKASALRYLDRANAILLPAGALPSNCWSGVSLKLVARIPTFPIGPDFASSPDFVSFVTQKLRDSGK